MPSLWEVHLASPSPAPVSLRALHGLACHLLDGSPEHHRGQAKGFSVRPPRATTHGLAVGIGLSDDDLSSRLRKRAPVGSLLRLGSGHYRVSAPPVCLQQQTWPVEPLPAAPARWTVRFRSPTVIRHGSRPSPWISASALLRSVHDKLPRHLVADLPPPDARAVQSAVWVSDVIGEAEPMALQPPSRNGARGAPPFRGFVGAITYECADRDLAVAVDRLFRVAPYTGVGSYTGYGCGAVSLGAGRR